MSGGGTMNSGPTGSVTLTNNGVVGLSAGTAIAVSGSAGGTFTVGNMGVTSVSGGTGVSASASTGSVSISIGQSVATNASPTFNGLTLSSLSADADGSQVYGAWTLASGATWQATFADLAEWYTSDAEYEPGTVLIFGGDKEVTTTTVSSDTRVAGVVSTDAAYVLNVAIKGAGAACIALQGRVPVKVIGTVRKGDMLTTSNTPGYATKALNPQLGSIIGKALEDKTDPGMGVIEVAIGRM